MPYPFHLLENEKILVPAQDVETFIRQFVSRRLFLVENSNLDEASKRFQLLFWQRAIGLDRYMNNGEIGKVYWGGIEIIEWNDSTEITRMWAHTPEDWYVGKLSLDMDKEMEKRFELLEKLSNEIKEIFGVLSAEIKNNSENVTMTKSEGKNRTELTIKRLDSIVHNTLLVFQGFEIERRVEGSNIFYEVFANVESERLLLGVYRVWEWHDGSGRSGWMPSDNDNPNVLRLRETVWQAIIAIGSDAVKSETIMQPISMGRIKGGRPRNVDDA
jgi:hypothetical protein